MDERPSSAAAVGKDEEAPVCFKCFEPYRLGTARCEHCGGPVGDYAMALPFESAVQEGRLLGEAALATSPSLAIVVGVWCVVLPWVAASSLAMTTPFRDGVGPERTPAILRALEVVPQVAWIALLLHVAIRTTLHHVRGRRASALGERAA